MTDDQFNRLMATLSTIALHTAISSAQSLKKEPLSDSELDGVQVAVAQSIQISYERLSAGQDPFVDWAKPFESLRSVRPDDA